MARAVASIDPVQYQCIRFFRVLMLLGLTLIACRLFAVQVLCHDDYEKQAKTLVERQRVLPAERGSICDRRGRELAADRPALNVYVRPKDLTDPWQTAVELGKALGKDSAALARSIAERPEGQLPIAQAQEASLSTELAATIQRERKGLVLEPIRKRVYPRGSVAADLLGFVGREHRGLEGLEHTMDHRLQGRPGLAVGEVDVFGGRIEHRTDTIQAPQDGDSIWLTIDADLQEACERKLAEAVEACEGTDGYAIVMHAPTGRVLAACDYPTFDLSRWSKVKEETWRPGFATWTFEPGSTVKPLVFARALEEGVIASNESFYCDGTQKVADTTVKCHSPSGGHGRLGVSGVLRVSCNDASAQVGMRMGAKRMSSLFESLGFTQSPTDEIQSQYQLLPAYLGTTWCANSAFGQGISITPLHLTAAFAALANGGRLVRPEFIEATAGADGRKVERRPGEGQQVYRKDIADLICHYLVETVEASDGTGREAAVPGVRVAGKTGTAQIPSPSGGYLADRFVVSFVGIVPADNPEWVVTVVINQPGSGNAWGGTIAAPAFREIAASVCRILGTPDKPS